MNGEGDSSKLMGMGKKEEQQHGKESCEDGREKASPTFGLDRKRRWVLLPTFHKDNNNN